MTPKEEAAEFRKRLDDLERRQDNSERFQSWITGGLTALGGVGTAVVLLLVDKFKRVMGLG